MEKKEYEIIKKKIINDITLYAYKLILNLKDEYDIAYKQGIIQDVTNEVTDKYGVPRTKVLLYEGGYIFGRNMTMGTTRVSGSEKGYKNIIKIRHGDVKEMVKTWVHEIYHQLTITNAEFLQFQLRKYGNLEEEAYRVQKEVMDRIEKGEIV